MSIDDTYDVSKGPVPTAKGGRLSSRRQQRVPADLARSRRIGLITTVCANCGAKDHEGRLRHASGCDPSDFGFDRLRLKTGPMLPDQTSKDTGWTLAS